MFTVGMLAEAQIRQLGLALHLFSQSSGVGEILQEVE